MLKILVSLHYMHEDIKKCYVVRICHTLLVIAAEIWWPFDIKLNDTGKTKGVVISSLSTKNKLI